MTSREKTKPIIESLLFTQDKPLTVKKIEEVIPELEEGEIRTILSELMTEYQADQRGIQVIEIANGFQMCTKKQYEEYVQKLLIRSRSRKMSKPALETLSIIAYKQPITKVEIEALRGVESGGVIRSLLEARLIKMGGRKSVPGRPILYHTTEDFLGHFGLNDLSELPPLHEVNRVMEER